MSDISTTYKVILGYAVFFAIVYTITRSRLGYVIVYYILALILLFLFVTQYQFIGGALQNVGTPSGTK